MEEEKTITIENLKQKMIEICRKCPNGNAGYCGDCHFDELAEKYGIRFD